MIFCAVAGEDGSVLAAYPSWAPIEEILGQNQIEVRRALKTGSAGCRLGILLPSGQQTAVQVRLDRCFARGAPLLLLTAAAPPSSGQPSLLYAAGHDLEEPLRTLHIYAQLLERKYGGLLDGEGSRLLSVVISNARHMTRLVASLLTLARLAALGHADETAVAIDLNAALGEAMASLDVLIHETGARILSHHLPVVMAFPGDLPQLFQNLISNAIKYRRPGDAPRVHISAQRTGAAWRISVRDEGAGFRPEEAEEIFQPFSRLRPSIEGSGLGLAICRGIVARMGGVLWAESQPDLGAVFHFTARPADPGAPLKATSGPAPSPGKPRK